MLYRARGRLRGRPDWRGPLAQEAGHGG